MTAPPIVQAKLHVPGLTSAPVVRERLVRRLDAHLGRVILLSAPAGFGKTVLVADWIGRRAVPTAWLSLDSLDNDPVRFGAHLAAALEGLEMQGVEPVAEAVRRAARREGGEQADLREALAAVEHEVLLVLDDLHELQAPRVLRLVDALVYAPVSALRVVLLGRVDPATALGRLRVSGQLLELRARDLAFTPDEAERLLDAILERSLGSSVVRTLTERTEGWPAGLRLAGIALIDVEDPHAFVASFSGTHRFVTEYLMEEALGRQAPELQQFLMESAVLARFDAACCREVLGDPQAPIRLAEATEANLFVVPLGEGGGWYRYHHLFGELLSYRLSRLQPERFQALQAGASRWFEARGDIQEALEHAARMEDRTRLLALLDAHGLTLIGRSEMAGVRRWLGRVEATDAGPYPLAFCTEAWLRVVTERVPDLEPLLARIEEALEAVPSDYPAPRRTQAALHTRVLGAYAARYRHHLDEALRIGREAEALLAGDDSLTRGFLVYNTARVRMALGEMKPAADLLDRAFPDHLRAGNRYLTLATLGRQGAILAQTRGVQPALEALAAALAFVRERGLEENPALSIVHFHRGWAHLLADDLDEADAAFVQALERAGPRDFPEERGNALVGRARVAMARGDVEAADGHLAEVVALDQVGNVDLFETTLPLERFRLTLRRRELGAGPPAPTVPEEEMPAEEGDEDGWDVHRETATILALRQELHRDEAEGGPGPSHPAVQAERLVRESASRERGPALLTGLLVQALDPEVRDRWTITERALRLSAARGYVRPVMELGPSGVALLRAAIGQPDLSLMARRRAESLLARFDGLRSAAGTDGGVVPVEGGVGRPPTPDGPAASLVEPLTPREEEVLIALFSGGSNRAIARSLYVSVDTVKTHLKHVYAKLGVAGRAEAIVRAQEMGYGREP